MMTTDPNGRKALRNQLDDAARKLGLPPLPQLYIGLAVRDEESGEEIMSRREEGHSWTRNGWSLMFSTMGDAAGGGVNAFGAGYMSAKTLAGVVANSSAYVSQRGGPGATASGHISASGNSIGILVGSGNTAFSADDYVLASIIAHSSEGATDGTLGYRGMSPATKTYNATSKVWTSVLAREFKNGGLSTTTLTVREVGLAWSGGLFSSSGNTFLTARDVLGSPVTVAPGQVLTVNYEISMDFSAID